MVHKCLLGKAPNCLIELISFCQTERTVKLTPYAHKGAYGNRCFARVGPKLWDLLPPTVREESDTDVFKKKLKTYLFDGYERLAQKLKER